MVDADGVVLKRDVVARDPDVLAKWLGKHCPGLVRVVLETGPLSTFLYHGLIERGIPAGDRSLQKGAGFRNALRHRLGYQGNIGMLA